MPTATAVAVPGGLHQAHPPGADPPTRDQAPPGSRPPPGAATPLGVDTPPPQSGSKHPPCTVHAGRYGQQVGGMHPTGMQFLFFCKFTFLAYIVTFCLMRI